MGPDTTESMDKVGRSTLGAAGFSCPTPTRTMRTTTPIPM